MISKTNIYFPKDDTERIYLKSIWKLTEDAHKSRKEIILPKGTVEIIFNYSNDIRYISPSHKISAYLPVVFINGINFKPFELVKYGYQEFLGIQLNAPALKLLFGIPASEFNNTVYEGGIICNDLSVLSQELYYEKSFAAQVKKILNWKNNRINNSKFSHSLKRAGKILSVKLLNEFTVKKLCNDISISERQLRRFLTEWFGMNTENTIRYKKYLTALHRMHRSEQTLTKIGLDSGYYDQPHFIRDFRHYTQLTPKQYQNANKGIPGHIFL